MDEQKEARYLSMRKAAERPDVPPEWALRKLQKRGLLPGFSSGARFYVDMYRLPEALKFIGEEQAAGRMQ